MTSSKEMSTMDQKLDRVISLLTMYIEEIEKSKEGEEQHRKEHEFLRRQMELAEIKSQFWRAALTRVVSGSIWSVMIAICGAVLFSIKSFFNGAV